MFIQCLEFSFFRIFMVEANVWFLLQRIGYLAASQTFHEGTDVLMLTTNMIRKVPVVLRFRSFHKQIGKEVF